MCATDELLIFQALLPEGTFRVYRMCGIPSMAFWTSTMESIVSSGNVALCPALVCGFFDPAMDDFIACLVFTRLFD